MIFDTFKKFIFPNRCIVCDELLPFGFNLENEFFDVISITEGSDFKNKSLSRIKNTLNNPKRKSEELQEMISYFNDENLVMVKADLEKFSQL